MAVAEPHVPRRLLAGGGPGSPDPRVLRALTTPVIGQFDPAFTAIMDDVMTLARQTFRTVNQRCFPVSALAPGGLEAVVNSLIEPGDEVAVGGGPRFVSQTGAMARRYGAEVISADALGSRTRLLVVPQIDPVAGAAAPLGELAARAHAVGAKLVVDATLGLGALELPVDECGVDVCVAGVDYALGAPSGMTLLTYSAGVESLLHARAAPPRTSYLDLVQLQAYWSPERLNHHTAPTSLVYGLREALRLAQIEGLEESCRRHQACGRALRSGLAALGLDVSGDGPYAIVKLRDEVSEHELRLKLLERFGVSVRAVATQTWRVGLLGADARPETVRLALLCIEQILTEA